MSEIEETDTVKTLRKRGDDAVAEAKALREQLAGLQKELRGVKYGETFKARNVPPKVADLIPADADVEAWLDEYGFAKPEQKAVDNTAPVAQPIANTPAGIDPAVVQAMSAMQQAEAGAIPLAGGFEKALSDLRSLSGKSGDDLIAAIKQVSLP